MGAAAANEGDFFAEVDFILFHALHFTEGEKNQEAGNYSICQIAQPRGLR